MNMTASLDLKTGVFTAPSSKEYIVTLTAKLGPFDNSRLQTYAQMFILKNGQLMSTGHYIVVTLDEVSSLTDTVYLETGDTLEVLVGHHVSGLTGFGSSGQTLRYDGGSLQDVRFCIF